MTLAGVCRNWQIPMTSMYLPEVNDEGEAPSPLGWDPTTHSEADVQAIRDAQMNTETVFAWGAPFVSLLECMVYSVVATKNGDVIQDLKLFNKERMAYYASDTGIEAFETAFFEMDWPQELVFAGPDHGFDAE